MSIYPRSPKSPHPHPHLGEKFWGNLGNWGGMEMILIPKLKWGWGWGWGDPFPSPFPHFPHKFMEMGMGGGVPIPVSPIPPNIIYNII